MDELIWGDEMKAMKKPKPIDTPDITPSEYGPDYNKPVANLSEGELAEQYKLLCRFVVNYPTREEMEDVIATADADEEKCRNESKVIRQEIEKEERTLPKLLEKAQKAHTAVMHKRGVIERLQNAERKAQDMKRKAAQEKRRAEARLADGLGRLPKISPDDWPHEQANRRNRLASIVKEMQARGIL